MSCLLWLCFTPNSSMSEWTSCVHHMSSKTYLLPHMSGSTRWVHPSVFFKGKPINGLNITSNFIFQGTFGIWLWRKWQAQWCFHANIQPLVAQLPSFTQKKWNMRRAANSDHILAHAPVLPANGKDPLNKSCLIFFMFTNQSPLSKVCPC